MRLWIAGIGFLDLQEGEVLPPPELTVPEPFQYLRPDLQLTAAELTGEQRYPVLTEFKDLNRPSKIAEPNVWSATFKIGKTMERGTWTLVRLGLADQANNFYTYFVGRDEILNGITVDFLADEDAQGRRSRGENE